MAVSSDVAEVRRRDREKSDEWIRAFLHRAQFGFLASTVDGQPFLNSNLFVYDEPSHAIYTHTARVGRTVSNVEGGARIAFSAAVMGRLLPADEALEFSVEYSAVVVFGIARLVSDSGEKRSALELLLKKYAPHLVSGRDYRPITAAELKRTAVQRIEITEWSGKEKTAAPDFPGAYAMTSLHPPAVQEPENA